MNLSKKTAAMTDTTTAEDRYKARMAALYNKKRTPISTIPIKENISPSTETTKKIFTKEEIAAEINKISAPYKPQKTEALYDRTQIQRFTPLIEAGKIDEAAVLIDNNLDLFSAEYLYENACQLFDSNEIDKAEKLFTGIASIKNETCKKIVIDSIYSLAVIACQRKRYDRAISRCLTMSYELKNNPSPWKDITDLFHDNYINLFLAKIFQLSTESSLTPLKQFITNEQLEEVKDAIENFLYINEEQYDCLFFGSKFSRTIIPHLNNILSELKLHLPADKIELLFDYADTYCTDIKLAISSDFDINNTPEIIRKICHIIPVNLIRLDDLKLHFTEQAYRNLVIDILNEYKKSTTIETPRDSYKPAEKSTYLPDISDNYQIKSIDDNKLKYFIFKRAVFFRRHIQALPLYLELKAIGFPISSGVENNFTKLLVRATGFIK